MTKIIKGRLFSNEDGSAIFEPYNCNPAENTPWVTLSVVENGQLKRTEQILQMRITTKIGNCGKMQSELMHTFTKLLCAVTEKNLNKRKEMMS